VIPRGGGDESALRAPWRRVADGCKIDRKKAPRGIARGATEENVGDITRRQALRSGAAGAGALLWNEF
jgi:hypothetical protein